VAQKLKALRHLHGALDLETIEARPVFDGDELKDFEAERTNRAKDIIEDFMIAANGDTARYLASKKVPSLGRVVRTCCSNQELESGSMLLSPARPTRARGSAFCIRPLKEA
jgi:exoribonuclease R